MSLDSPRSPHLLGFGSILLDLPNVGHCRGLCVIVHEELLLKHQKFMSCGQTTHDVRLGCMVQHLLYHLKCFAALTLNTKH